MTQLALHLPSLPKPWRHGSTIRANTIISQTACGRTDRPILPKWAPAIREISMDGHAKARRQNLLGALMEGVPRGGSVSVFDAPASDFELGHYHIFDICVKSRSLSLALSSGPVSIQKGTSTCVPAVHSYLPLLQAHFCPQPRSRGTSTHYRLIPAPGTPIRHRSRIMLRRPTVLAPGICSRIRFRERATLRCC